MGLIYQYYWWLLLSQLWKKSIQKLPNSYLLSLVIVTEQNIMGLRYFETTQPNKQNVTLMDLDIWEMKS